MSHQTARMVAIYKWDTAFEPPQQPSVSKWDTAFEPSNSQDGGNIQVGHCIRAPTTTMMVAISKWDTAFEPPNSQDGGNIQVGHCIWGTKQPGWWQYTSGTLHSSHQTARMVAISKWDTAFEPPNSHDGGDKQVGHCIRATKQPGWWQYTSGTLHSSHHNNHDGGDKQVGHCIRATKQPGWWQYTWIDSAWASWCDQFVGMRWCEPGGWHTVHIHTIVYTHISMCIYNAGFHTYMTQETYSKSFKSI